MLYNKDRHESMYDTDRKGTLVCGDFYIILLLTALMWQGITKVEHLGIWKLSTGW